MPYTYELYHHGIKGMKWGVRRFQNQNGTLTNAGKKRYRSSKGNINNKKINYRTAVEQHYRNKGLSEADAKKAADKRIKAEKVVAATVGLTIAACAAYYAKNRYVANRTDQILKKGTSFHNIHSEMAPRPGEHLYVNYRQNDTHYYRGSFAVNKMKANGHVFDHVLTANEDVKIPSLKTRKSVFKQLFDNDEEFRNAFNQHSAMKTETKSSRIAYKLMWRRFGDKKDPKFNIARRKYFEALRQKGYDAIVDELDSRKTVFRVDAPLILLNTSSKSFGEMKIRELSTKDILISQANSRNHETAQILLNNLLIPHTNHFKESAKRLSWEAKKNAKNTEYVEKAISKMTEEQVKKLATMRGGELVADAGKFIAKHENMPIKKAMKLVYVKNRAKYYGTIASSVGTVVAPKVGASYALNRKTILNYRQEHPNSKLTDQEILRMLKNKKKRR